MRKLGIDYGDSRVGIAISDELGITAQGLCTICLLYTSPSPRD